MLWLPRSCSTWSGCAPTSQSLCCSRFLNACVAFCTLCAGPEVAGDLEDSGESGRPACTRAHAGEWRQVEARKLAECWAKMSKTDSSRASVVCSVGCLALWGVGVGVGGWGVQGYQMCLISLHIAPNRYSTQDKLRAQPDFRAKYGCDADGVRTSMSPSDVASKGGVYNASTRAADASSLVATTLSEVFATCLRAPLSRRRVETDVRVESSRPCFATLTHPSGFRKTRPATWGGGMGCPAEIVSWTLRLDSISVIFWVISSSYGLAGASVGARSSKWTFAQSPPLMHKELPTAPLAARNSLVMTRAGKRGGAIGVCASV